MGVGDIPLIYKYTYLYHLNCISKVNMIATHAWASATYAGIYSCAVSQIRLLRCLKTQQPPASKELKTDSVF